jgi:hypothetical protein
MSKIDDTKEAAKDSLAAAGLAEEKAIEAAQAAAKAASEAAAHAADAVKHAASETKDKVLKGLGGFLHGMASKIGGDQK